MKIFFYYLQDLDIDRGTPLRARNIIKFLSKKHEAVVVAEKLSSPELLSRVKFYPIKKYSYPKGLNFFYKVRDLKRIIKATKPDILYGFTCNSLFSLGLIAKQLKIPLVIEMHEAGHKGLDPNVIWRSLLGFFEKKALKQVSGLVAVSSKIKDYYLALAKNPNLPAQVIYGGVDIDLFNLTAPLAPEIQAIKKQGKMIIGYIGSFKDYQGVDFILASALENCQDFLYIMVGGDSQRLRDRIAQGGLQDKVFLFGKKKYETIPGFLRGMDIMVIPRASLPITEYAFPSKLSEYMAMGKAVVITDVGGSKEVIKDKENGILIPADNIVQNLINSFDLLKANPELKNKIEKNALNFVRDNLTWQKQTEKLNTFLQWILKTPQKIKQF